MKFYKFLILFFILIAFFMSINLIELQSISKDNTPLVIKITRLYNLKADYKSKFLF